MRPRLGALVATLGVFASASACGPRQVIPAPPPRAASSSPPPRAIAPSPADPLGPPPSVPIAPPFRPPAPTVYTTGNGMTVWLVERHGLPVVAVTVVVPTGSSSDPKGEAGLADQTARMLGEGAGKRDALELARAVDDLGAKLEAGVTLDASHVHLAVAKRGFSAGMQLLGDVVIRPRWEAAEWKRQHDLWQNELKERAADPEAIADDAASAVLFGRDQPYGHPVTGSRAAAPRVQLAEAKRFWAEAWRPDRATVVAVGDVTRGELDEELATAFGAWTASATPPAPPSATPPPVVVDRGEPSLKAGEKTAVFVVDRPEAPQTVVRWVRPGVAAADPLYPPLYRANIALGGSLTSRLVRDLREVRGWAYAAASRVTAARNGGVISVGGTFVTEKTAEALGAMLGDLDDFARGGLTEEEAAKTRMQARSEIVGEYETVDRTSIALAHDAALGLGPAYEAEASALADQADRGALGALAARFFERAGGVIVVVGPRAKLEGPLAKAGLGPITRLDAEGALVKGAK